MKIKFLIFIFLFTSCSLEPKYSKPKTPVTLSANPIDKTSITKISWPEFFTSSDLQRVIQLTLDHNLDLKIANLNIAIAQETHGVARANLLPNINAAASETRQGIGGSFAAFTPKRIFRANVSLTTYELDFFGRLRSLKKSAWEDFLAAQEAYKITRISLIAEAANAYAQLLLDKENLKIAEENLELQNKKYELIKLRHENKIDASDILLSAETDLENAKNNLEIYQKLFNQDRSALMALVGIFDEKTLPLDNSINQITINENLLDFLPSVSLLSRPDIQQAEHLLKAANADIGAARAAFFPSISLTGSYGYTSRDLDKLLNSKNWNFTPQINLPIFSGGRNIANLEISNLRKKVEITNYEKTIQTAFREVLDGLSQRQAASNQLKSWDKILQNKEKSTSIASAKYKAGIYNSLNEIDAKIALLTTKQNQLAIKKEYIANLIALYKIMGGGSES